MIEKVRQLCLCYLDDTPDLDKDCSDIEFDKYFSTKYPLVNLNGISNWKTGCFDMADAIFDINHPQANDISSLLYSSIFISIYRRENDIKLKQILNILKDDPMAYIDFTKLI